MEKSGLNDEIDLLEVLARFCRVILTNKFLILGCILAGLALGYAFNTFIKKQSWIASAMISTDLLSVQESEFLMQELTDDTITGFEGNKNVISLRHSISQTINNDKSTALIFLKLTATTRSRDVFPSLQSAFVSHINNSEPVVRKAKEKELYCTELLKCVTTELESMERMKNKMEEKSYTSQTNPSDLYVKAIELHEKKIHCQQALADLKSVHIVQGFEPKEKAKSTIIILMVGLVSGFLLSLLIMFLKFFIPYYKQFQKHQA